MRWIWWARGFSLILLITIGIWMIVVGLDKANAVGGAVGLLIAIAALVAPYILPASGAEPPKKLTAENTGRAKSSDGGQANTGIKHGKRVREAEVNASGEAIAKGPNSSSNSGITD